MQRLENLFTDRSLNQRERRDVAIIRAAGLEFARKIRAVCPAGAAADAAIAKALEAVWTVRGAIESGAIG